MAQPTKRRTAAARALDTVVDRLAGEVSASRLRQLRMVVGMWDRALDGHWPAGARRPRSARTLFDDEPLDVFWELAVAGQLRADGAAPRRGRDQTPTATLRVVRDCLGVLAQAVQPGAAVVLPEVRQQDPKPAVPREQLPALYRTLVDMAAGAPEERGAVSLPARDRVRLLAIVAVELDTAARASELEGMRLQDLAEGETSLQVRRQPQNGRRLAFDEMCPLRDGTRVALRRWLRLRADLVGTLQGTEPDALWVSLRPNQWQPQAGFPLRAQGVMRAYARGMGALNMLMAGQHGWEPMPRTLEQLRRTVAAEPRTDAGADAGEGSDVMRGFGNVRGVPSAAVRV